MPSIKITDQLGASIDAQLAPTSSLLKYASALPGLLMQGGDIGQLQILSLNDPAVRGLQPGLSFQQPLNLGKDMPQLTVGANAGVSFRVLTRTPQSTALFTPDDYGSNLEIPADACYVSVGFQASVQAGLQAASGALTFGMDAGSGIAIDSYRMFSLGPDAITVTAALQRSISDFVIPAHPDDLASLPAGVIVTLNGHGCLKFSATANLLARANPLATVALPSPLPTLAVTQSGALTVGASWKIETEYQVRIQKIDASRVQLGWFRKRDSEFGVTAAAGAGLAAGTADTDLFSSLIGAISSNAQADQDALSKAGLSQGQIDSINDAVQAAVNRKLELAVSAELGSLASEEAAFLYDVDLSRLDAIGAQTLSAALTGDLTGLANHNALPAGVTEVRSILTRARSSRFALKVNLLGIFNLGSLSQLALRGTVTFTPSTGDLVIADTATASRIQTAAVNFGADEQKLRHVMAESFLITAAYRGSGTVVAPPQLSSSHLFFRLDNHTNRDTIRRFAAIAPALGLVAPPIPGGVPAFGRCTVAAEASYDDAAAESLFLTNGAPRQRSEYEAAGRSAVALLVPPDADDSFRLRPVTNDGLWNQMKDLGPANFQQVLPQTQADGVRPDYLAIEWWADSMRGAAEILAEMNRPGADPNDPRFQQLRLQLAAHLRDVASKAREEFGAPWGLVAMFLVSGKVAHTSMHITGPSLVFSAERALGTAG